MSLLGPLTYHREVVEYFKAEEPALWRWYASTKAQAQYVENMQMELLKSTYRLDDSTHPELLELAGLAAQSLDIDVPITFYQAQQAGSQENAALCYSPGSIHVVIFGAILERLSREELLALLGHEFAHYLLWEIDDRDYHVADQILVGICNDPRAEPSHFETRRRFQLYTEIFADRGALMAVGSTDPVISGLVKVETGLNKVNAKSYQKQAEEIFAKGPVSSENSSHPETFIRTHALSLWASVGKSARPVTYPEGPDEGAALAVAEESTPTHTITPSVADTTEPEVAADALSCEDMMKLMIEGECRMELLDLLQQRSLAAATRNFLVYLLSPSWFRTESTLAQANLFFDNFVMPDAPVDTLPDGLRFADGAMQDYLCYLMLDFAVVDPDLSDLPLQRALFISGELDMVKRFDAIVNKELKIKMRDLNKLRKTAQQALNAVRGVAEGVSHDA